MYACLAFCSDYQYFMMRRDVVIML